MIPIFAFVYSRLPYHFYHSTVKHEDNLRVDADQIALDLKNAIISNFQGKYGANTLRRDEHRTDIASISVGGVNAKNDRLHFSLYSEESADNSGANGTDWNSLTLTNSSFFRAQSNGDQMFGLEEDGPKNLNKHFELHDYCPIHSGFVDGMVFGFDGFLVLSPLVQSRINAYLLADSGFPSGASGNFFRMLYFSAITITTVGFGDIVPITPLARSLVASEAVLGVILVGLFLNGIARRSLPVSPHTAAEILPEKQKRPPNV